ncbi:MAG: hypothetical protein HYX67_02965 [Candidatus Melainabacteria bacterium]|nr:hypothetical protein [Candidatus Melainabacteria bacterium]
MAPLLPSDNKPMGAYFENSHPKAKKLLVDKFFWIYDYSPIVGSDTAPDAVADFWEWLDFNKSPNVSAYINETLEEWVVDIDRMRAAQGSEPKKCTGEFSSDANMYDEFVVAIAYAQFMKLGYVDANVRALALTAITRQLDPQVIEYRHSDPEESTTYLTKIKDALTQMDVR